MGEKIFSSCDQIYFNCFPITLPLGYPEMSSLSPYSFLLPNPSLFWETWLRPTHMQQYILSECTFYSTKQHCKALAHLPFMFISPFHFKFFLRVCSLGLLPVFLNTNITFPQAITAFVFVSLPCLHSPEFTPCFCLFSPVFPSSHLFNLPNRTPSCAKH